VCQDTAQTFVPVISASAHIELLAAACVVRTSRYVMAQKHTALDAAAVRRPCFHTPWQASATVAITASSAPSPCRCLSALLERTAPPCVTATVRHTGPARGDKLHETGPLSMGGGHSPRRLWSVRVCALLREAAGATGPRLPAAGCACRPRPACTSAEGSQRGRHAEALDRHEDAAERKRERPQSFARAAAPPPAESLCRAPVWCTHTQPRLPHCEKPAKSKFKKKNRP